jgi:hypothetical protein
VNYNKGYGKVSKSVMTDRNLTIESKAIYSYLCSFAGNKDEAFPSVKKICYDLKINVKRFYKHMGPLIDKGYIEVHRIRYADSKQWANNVYKLKD